MTSDEAAKMKAKEAQAYLVRLIRALDEADCDDVFGTEGWRRYLMSEDR